MKWKKHILFVLLGFSLSVLSVSSCKTGEGCAATEHYKAKTDKDGNLSKKKGRSNLFSKKQRKRMKKKRS